MDRWQSPDSATDASRTEPHAARDRLLLKQAAYWVCLHDQPRREELGKHSRVSVSVPRANLLTPQSLMEVLRYGERLQLQVRGLTIS